MRRLPAISFGALVAATVAAFFITQHLKVTTPLLAGAPRPYPAAINPLDGTICGGVDHRRMVISFYLLHRSDDVDVYMVDQTGAIVRTLATGRHMEGGAHPVRREFVWNGREDSGQLAPDGIYYVKVALIHQGRTVTISDAAGPEPVRIKTVPPAPVVTRATPQLIPQGSRTTVTITYGGNENRGGTVEVYRTDLPGKPALVKSFLTPWRGRTAVWDGRIRNRPAPAGTYLVGLDVTDVACNTGRFPPAMPPPPHSTPRAGVTVRYLAAEPPLDPVPAGSRAVVYVDSRNRAYRWWLYRVGVRKPIASGRSRGFALHAPTSPVRAALYWLRLESGSHSTAVPLVAHATRAARVLVVLPALTWQGLNPVDDDGDGLPDTLSDSPPVKLVRPFAHGLPAGFGEEGALLAYLDSSHHPYDLTTDLGLIDGVGPSLAGHAAVLLAGSEEWLPQSTMSRLRQYVSAGGSVLSLGLGSLLRSVTISGGSAQAPTQPASGDALGARPGPLVSHNTELIGVISDQLGIFAGTSGVFSGFGSYQPFLSVAPPGQIVSEAGVSSSAPSIVGYQLGRGTVVDVGLVGFASRLSNDVDAKELMNRLWTVLGGAG